MSDKSDSSKKIVLEVKEELCKGCGLCVEVCDRGKLQLDDRPNKQGVQPAVVCPGVDCTGCCDCATICPDAAIEIYIVTSPELAGSAEE